MHRMIKRTRLLLLAAAFLALPGCSFFDRHRPAGDPTVVPAARLHTLLLDDRARLAGEDSALSRRRVVSGVNITDDPWYYAPFHVVGGVVLHWVEYFQGERPLKYANEMEDVRSPDRRREGILRIVGYPFARKNPYTKRYAQIAQEANTDPTVKAAAIRALNRSRDKSATELYVRMLDNAESSVRLEAAKALANLPSDAAVAALVRHLTTEDSKDVRIACADALREYKTLDVSRALVNVLADRDFAVAWQARKSLNLMTGRDFRYDDAAWLDYFSKAGKPFL